MTAVITSRETADQQFQAGHYAAALSGYAQLLSGDPGQAELWHRAGLTALQLGRVAESIHYLRRAIDRNGQQAEYYSNLAVALDRDGQLESALDAVCQALELAPEFAPALYRAGKLLSRVGQVEAALNYLQRALDGGFDRVATLLELGQILQSSGRQDEAIRTFERVLSADPACATAWYQLSRFVNVHQYRFSPTQLDTLQKAIASASTGPWTTDDRARLHFTQAADFESRGDYSSAFEHFRAGNREYLPKDGIHNSGDLVSSQNLCQAVSHILKQLPPQSSRLEGDRRAATSASAKPAQPRPIFVIGFPRSGTTLLEQFLLQHPAIRSVGESTQFLERVAAPLIDKSTAAGSQPMSFRDLAEAANRYRNFLEAADSDAQFVIDKMPDNWQFVELIQQVLPEAIVISCRRDPRDTILSCYTQLFASPRLRQRTSSLEGLASEYLLYREVMHRWDHQDVSRNAEVFYEAWIADPAGELERLWNQLGLSCCGPLAGREPSESVVLTASSLQVRQPVYQTSRARWRHYLRQLEPILEILQPAIAEHERDLAAACDRLRPRD